MLIFGGGGILAPPAFVGGTCLGEEELCLGEVFGFGKACGGFFLVYDFSTGFGG